MIDHYYRPSSDPNNRIDDYLINEFLKAEKYLIIDDAHNQIDELNKLTTEMKNDYEQQIKDLRKEWLFTKFSDVIEDMIEKMLNES